MRNTYQPISGLIAATALSTAFASVTLAAVPVPAGVKQSDVQCLLLSNVFSKSAADDKSRQAAIAAHFYFLGRVRLELEDKEIGLSLAQAEKGLAPASAGPAMQACVKQVQAVQAAMDSVGRTLQSGAPH